MDQQERADLDWALKNKVDSLDKAHQERMASEEAAAEAALEAKRVAREKATAERDALVREVLVGHPDRWTVSIEGKRILGKKDISFPCPKCGTSVPGILEGLCTCMQATFPNWLAGSFENHDVNQRSSASDTKCPGCQERVHFRVIPIPY